MRWEDGLAKGFFDFAGGETGGADFHAAHASVDDGADFLDVRLEGALGDAGGLQADAALVFRQAATADGTAELCFLAADFANA